MDAMELLKSEKSVEQIINDITTVGYIGEDTNKLLAYLVATSRKMDNPLAAILQGPSSVGKSELQRVIFSLMPPEEVIDLTRVTPQAFFYKGLENPAIICHKIVSIEESWGSQSANYSIRSLLSEKELRLWTVINGEAIEINLKGPIAYFESTTMDVINDETANRVLIISISNAQKQTEAILEHQKRQASIINSNTMENIKIRHQEAQRLLKPMEVIISYAPEIRFPSDLIRFRREQKKFLDLIKIVAYLHQHQRKIEKDEDTGKEFVVANLDDYEVAYSLFFNTFREIFNDLSPKAKELFEQVERYVERGKKKNFTRGDIVRFTAWSLRQIRTYIGDLVELGYLKVIGGSKGKEYLYEITDLQTARRRMDITSPEELRGVNREGKVVSIR